MAHRPSPEIGPPALHHSGLFCQGGVFYSGGGRGSCVCRALALIVAVVADLHVVGSNQRHTSALACTRELAGWL